MLVAPCRVTAVFLYDFEDGVDADETVRKNRCTALAGISRQLIWIDASATIDGIAILVNRGIEDHRGSDLGAIGGRCRQATIIGVLENHPGYVGRAPRHHGKQARP